MTEYDTKKFIDVLPDLVNSYNNTVHNTIKISPIEAEKKSNEMKVRANLGMFYFRKRKRPVYYVGNLVRLVKLPEKFQRSYKGSVKPEIFKIIDISQRMPIPMYQLESIERNDEGPLEGLFYAEELSRVQSLRLKVLEKNDETGQVLVKWLDRTPETKGWINAEYLEKTG